WAVSSASDGSKFQLTQQARFSRAPRRIAKHQIKAARYEGGLLLPNAWPDGGHTTAMCILRGAMLSPYSAFIIWWRLTYAIQVPGFASLIGAGASSKKPAAGRPSSLPRPSTSTQHENAPTGADRGLGRASDATAGATSIQAKGELRWRQRAVRRRLRNS